MEPQLPDYVPPMWTKGRVNRWFAGSPRRVVGWFIVLPLLVVSLAAVFYAEGKTLRAVVVTLAALVLLQQAVVYAPRAWRAARRSGS